MPRPIDWVGDVATPHIWVLDQTRLPGETVFLQVETIEQLLDAIGRLAVRGAPALGVAGAMGVALAAYTLDSDEQVARAAAALRAARPTAVNLARGGDLALAALPQGREAVLAAAIGLRDSEIAASTAMARRGADDLYRRVGASGQALRLMTICNTGALATVERGTALAVIEQVMRDSRLKRVIACETRPLLQGARLTAWELTQLGAPFDLIVDAAAASVMARGLVDAVLVGADRITANGDVVNKIGTFALALAAQHAGIPLYAVAPESTVDLATASGDHVEIEDRGAAEVVAFGGRPTAPVGTSALNPAFDVTPAKLVTAIVTDRRVIDLGRGDLPTDPLPDGAGPAATPRTRSGEGAPA